MVDGHKIPHYIRMRDGGVFAFAGLWDHWEGKGSALDSCSIIVMPANEGMRALHERMPAISAPAHYDRWLDSRMTDKDKILRYMNPGQSSQLRMYPVSPWVNSPKHDDERCIQAAG